jgi:hypothetical protein
LEGRGRNNYLWFRNKKEMKKQLEELKTQIELFEIKQSEQVENFRLKFLSKKTIVLFN